MKRITSHILAVCFLSLSTLNASDAHTYYVEGNRLCGSQPRAAIQAYRNAIQADPNYFEAHFNLANELFKQNNFDEATTYYERSQQLNPDCPQAFFNCGLCYAQKQDYHRAIELYKKAIQLQRGYTKAWINLGNAYRKISANSPEALDAFEEALKLEPNNFDIHLDLGRVYVDQCNFEQAEYHFKKALGLRPQHVHAILDYANMLNIVNRTEEAIEEYQKILKLHPGTIAALYNVAYSLKKLGRLDEAIAIYQEIIERDPNYVEGHFGLGLAYLMKGEFHKGWPGYEWRWKRDRMKERTFPKPKWCGESLAGKRLLLHAEQGLGDTFQFIRYAKVAHDMGAYVIAAVQNPLSSILKQCPYIDEVYKLYEGLPEFDYHAALLSMPLILDTEIDTVPTEIPYLFADESLVDVWRDRLADDTNVKIGICWQGNSNYPTHFLRLAVAAKSVPLNMFERLANIPGVTLYNLQKETGEQQLDDITFQLVSFGPDFDHNHGRFMDTAAVMKNLDLIITIDTSTGHLSAGLGMPTWVLIPNPPDWRWMFDRTDTPWYPTTMHLFRQPTPGNWERVFDDIEQELRAFVAAKRNTSKTVSLKSSEANNIAAAISYGELIDKITILEIKQKNITDETKLHNITKELETLHKTRDQYLSVTPELNQLTAQLYKTNCMLWDIEDAIRDKERHKEFDDEFIQLARSVYHTNDQRCRIKRAINELYNSPLLEEKSYKPY